MTQAKLGWTQRGRESAAAGGVSAQEAIEALHAPTHSRFTRAVGDLTFVLGLAASSGRLILVVLDRPRGEDMFMILVVRLAGPVETDGFYRRTR